MKQILTILILAFASFTSFSQDAKSQEILDKLSKKMKAQNSFYVEFSANIKNVQLELRRLKQVKVG